MANAGARGFGIDQPERILTLLGGAAVSSVAGLGLAFGVQPVEASLARLVLLSLPLAGVVLLGLATSLCWNSAIGKPKAAERVMKEIPWGGSEVAVDVGCGRGLMMIGAAKNLADGLAVGVDRWNGRDLSGNDSRSIWANARAEGAEEKVAAIRADPQSLPFADGSVDVAMSGMIIHNVGNAEERRAALAEMVRITRNGGRVAVIDEGKGGEYRSILREMGLVDLRVSRLGSRSFPPLHTVMGRKPFSS